MKPWELIKKKEEKEEIKLEGEYEPKFPEPQKIEDKVETVVQEAPKVEKKAPAEIAEPVVIVSENDAYIHERMKSMPKTLEEVDMKVSTPQDDSVRNPLELPIQLKKYKNKFDFVWVSKKKKSMDTYLDVDGFMFVNPRLFPDLPRYLFTANGSIERGDLVLLFISHKKGEAIRNRPIQISQERVKNTPVQPLDIQWEDRGEKYYKPDSGVSERDGEVLRGNEVQVD